MSDADGGGYLIVVAHPDDEVLGAGATVASLTSRGVDVRSCILAGTAAARRRRPTDEELRSDTHDAAVALGMGDPIVGEFPNIAMNTVPHLHLVQFIEAAMEATDAAHLLTHHPSDLNDDHRHVSMACQAAARLSSRKPGASRLRSLHYMEVVSSTDWAFPGSSEVFRPNAFYEVGEANIRRKLEALACYRDVMRPYPHPRSEEAIRGLATYRGGQANMDLAEAFQTAFFDLSAGT